MALIENIRRLIAVYRFARGKDVAVTTVQQLWETWSENDNFKQLMSQVSGTTLVTADRCFMLYQMARHAGNYNGDIAEVGVYKGGTARILAQACPDKKIHLFDTFNGLPAQEEAIDIHKQGDFSDTSLELVKGFLNDCSNVVFHPGFFPETTAEITGPFCFVHIDVDIYESVISCLRYFYPRVVKGGIIMFDDYYWPNTPGATKAVEEFFSDKPEKPIIAAKYQGTIIKI